MGLESEENIIVVNPTEINNFKNPIIELSTSQDHTLCLDNKGYLYSWGNNYGKKLGYKTDLNYQKLPKNIKFFNNYKIIDFQSISDHSIVIVKNDNNEIEIFTFGCNYYGQLGLETRDFDYHLPTKLNLNNLKINNENEIKLSNSSNTIIILFIF